MSSISSASFNQAVNAYQKILNSSRGIIPSPGEGNIQKPPQLNILRVGDVIDVVAKQNQNSFSGIVNEILLPQVNKIREGEAKTKKAIRSKEDLIEVMAAVNESEIALQAVIAIRDRFISAYQDVLKMPL